MRMSFVHGIALDSGLLTFFDSIVVVVADEVFDSPDKFFPASVDVAVVDFSFQ